MVTRELKRDALDWVNEIRVRAGAPTLAKLPPGVPCDPTGCSLARSLDAVIFHDGHVLLRRTGEMVLAPDPVLAFTRAFDVGAFPELEEALRRQPTLRRPRSRARARVRLSAR